MNLPDFFEQDRLAVDAALDRSLPAETTEPVSIHTAMRYSVFAGGKRLRPMLTLAAAAAVQFGFLERRVHYQ